MNSDDRGLDPGGTVNMDGPTWRRLMARISRALSDLLAASEPKRKRPRNLYIRGMTTRELVTRPYSDT